MKKLVIFYTTTAIVLVTGGLVYFHGLGKDTHYKQRSRYEKTSKQSESVKGISTVKPTETITPTSFIQSALITATQALGQSSPAATFKQKFLDICNQDIPYCSCLYDSLHQSHSDSDIDNEINSYGQNVFYEDGSNGKKNPMFSNALNECTNKFTMHPTN